MALKEIGRKGAIELSVSTIVVIVLAMSMLILGITLIRNIFQGATFNVKSLNEGVKSEINNLFKESSELRVYVYLPDNQAEVKKSKSFGVAFGIKNRARGESQSSRFSWDITASDVGKGCQLSLAQADSYLKLGDTGSVDLLPGGDPHYDIVLVEPPESAPLCQVKYLLAVKKDGQPYGTQFFIIDITD